METGARIFVAGHRGLLGSALVRRLRAQGHANLLLRTRAELDLTRQGDVEAFFAAERPEFVFVAAARVGGIYANSTWPADFIRENLLIEVNVIDAARRFGVKKLLFPGSSCIYPKHAPQPLREELLLSGVLEPTSQPYAVAKIAGIELCRSCNRQHGTDFLSVIPATLYGPNDSYEEEKSHVLPALIRRFHEAKSERRPWIAAWGSGTPRREFLFADDCADACIFLMKNYSGDDPVNVGTGEDIPIRELTHLVAEVVGYRGQVRWDASKPDGTPRKLLDVSRLHALGWRHRTDFAQGLRAAYEDFLSR